MAASKLEKNRNAWEAEIGKLLEAGLGGNRRIVEASALRLIRICRDERPDLAENLSKILSNGVFPTATRLSGGTSAPTDSDSNLGLLRISELDERVAAPILSETITQQLERFLAERKNSAKLIAAGLRPPSSLLLLGPPGTGKTMMARWLASQLDLPLATYDLATAISSFLGRTGMNIRKALDYARETPAVLLMDEFDSIAKRRGDSSEVGELSRVVNTLLKEMEDWPSHSVLISASNHGSLLDEAVFRRFDLVIHLNLPGIDQRRKIFCRSMERIRIDISETWADVIAVLTSGWNAADIERLSLDFLRNQVLSDRSISSIISSHIPLIIPENLDSQTRADLVAKIRKEVGKAIPYRILSDWFKISESTIHHHVNKSQPPT